MRKIRSKGIFFICFICLFAMFLPSKIHAAETERKMNALCLLGTDDAKNSFYSMSNKISDNKLPKYTLNKCITHTYDCENRPTTKAIINEQLDSAFKNSTSNDINYFYIAAHGYSGTNEENKVSFPNTGIFLNVTYTDTIDEVIYKYNDLARKLSSYKGEFVVIIDACFSGNFITQGLENLNESEASRFTVICSTQDNEYAFGALGYQFYTNDLVKSLTYNLNGINFYSADANNDGFITLQEIYDNVGTFWSKEQYYGTSSKILFHFGSVTFNKKTVDVDISKNKTVKLYPQRNNCTLTEKIAWKSSDTSVATVDQDGKVTWKSNGKTNITAYIVDANGYPCPDSEGTCTVTFKGAEIKITPSSKTIKEGDSLYLTGKVNGTSSKITWYSSNKKVATVSGGKVKALGKGTTTITASVKVGGKIYKATSKITVKALTKAEKAKKAYYTYMKKHKAYYYKIVDVDKNGIPELLGVFANDYKNSVFSYDAKKNKIVTIVKYGGGKIYGPYYNQKDHTVVVYGGSTGNAYYHSYKITGTKGKLLHKYHMDIVYPTAVGQYKNPVYRIDGKKVSETTFNKKMNTLLWKNKNAYEIYWDYWSGSSKVRSTYRSY